MERTSKRLRVTAEDKVENLDQADERLARIRERHRQQQTAIDRFRAAIRDHLTVAEAEFGRLEAENRGDVLAIEGWWKSVGHRAVKGKSAKLPNGTIGTRVVGGGWDMPPDDELLARLMALGMDNLIIIEKRPDKAAIKKEIEAHDKLGVQRKAGEDRFFAQVDGDQVERFVAVLAALRGEHASPETV